MRCGEMRAMAKPMEGLAMMSAAGGGDWAGESMLRLKIQA